MHDPARNDTLPSVADRGRRRLGLALLVSLPWFSITVLGGAAQTAGQGTLLETVREGVGFGFLGAATVLLQAIAATLSAFLFVAIRLPTGETSVAPGSPPAEAVPPNPFPAILPALPNFLDGLYLLRGIGRLEQAR